MSQTETQGAAMTVRAADLTVGQTIIATTGKASPKHLNGAADIRTIRRIVRTADGRISLSFTAPTYGYRLFRPNANVEIV